MDKKNRNIWTYLALLINALEIMYLTVFSREVNFSAEYQFVPFASVVENVSDKGYLLQLVFNVLLFVPFGYILKKTKVAVLCSVAFSVFIELVQLLFRVGVSSVDDIIANVLGAFIGSLIALAVSKLFEKKCNALKPNMLELLNKIVIVILLIIMSASCVMWPSVPAKPNEASFYFDADITDDCINGTCFVYGKDAGDDDFEIVLKGEDDIYLDTKTGIDNSSVAKVYYDGNDYSKSGFSCACPTELNGSYEIVVKWKKHKPTSTGMFLENGKIRKCGNEADFDLGELVVSNEHCMVFVKANCVYWVKKDNHNFNDNAIVFYHIYTNQVDKLSEDRLEYGFDNSDYKFCDYEVESINGYRVAMRELPSDYAVTYVETGELDGDERVWSSTFRVDC